MSLQRLPLGPSHCKRLYFFKSSCTRGQSWWSSGRTTQGAWVQSLVGELDATAGSSHTAAEGFQVPQRGLRILQVTTAAWWNQRFLRVKVKIPLFFYCICFNCILRIWGNGHRLRLLSLWVSKKLRLNSFCLWIDDHSGFLDSEGLTLTQSYVQQSSKHLSPKPHILSPWEKSGFMECT